MNLSSLLISNQAFAQSLSKATLEILRSEVNPQYLDTLAELALDSKHTSTIFVTHEALFVEICSRWLDWLHLSPTPDPLAMLAALASILPYAPYLSVFVEELIFRRQTGILQVFASREATALRNLPDKSLHHLLLALCRLLMFDNERFASPVSPAQLQLVLQHPEQSIRYLAIKILCLYLHASDSAMAKMLERYCFKEGILGVWEDKDINYRFFSLWEEKRLENLGRELDIARKTCYGGTQASTAEKSLQPEYLSNTTACIGDVLVPRLEGKQTKNSSLVKTETFIVNARNFAIALNGTAAVLVTGLSGAGKSSLIRHTAKVLGKSESMVRLHLNEQTDAKLLIGMYATDNSPGCFTWRPGVLTKAVTEGRWIMIEDLDRAPVEILSTILPLLERRELLVPHWGRCIRAAPGFRLIATTRSYVNARGEEVIPGMNNLGFRHWLRVPLRFPTGNELADIIRHQFPILHAHVPAISRVYSSIIDRIGNSNVNSSTLTRPLGPQDLFRWCRRLDHLLIAAGIRSSNERISDTLKDLIFIEGVDCFAGIFPDGSNTKATIVDLIAQELHIPADRARYCLKSRKPEYVISDTKIRIGRTSILKRNIYPGWKSSGRLQKKSPFAMTTHAIRVLESIAVAVRLAEPCLLVGETGTGKTTIIQYLADLLGYRLTVVNLSQQSEAGDLLGGYKPLNIRALVVPMKEEFDDLFEQTFSMKKNRQYTDTVAKALSKGRWTRLLTLWQEALRMLANLSSPAPAESTVEPMPKRRRLDLPKFQNLKIRWDKFATSVQQLQAHLVSGPKGFAFSFFEGNIVKAARNGDWVLLDEINLASPDTLESLADLFNTQSGSDDEPSLLLSETGDTRRIRIHKDFRIFGAMNPATDIGKRDLPSSLRSRFSEIYLDSPDKDFDNLLAVIQVYLGSLINSDVRVATDVASLYLEIKRLAEQNQLVDGSNQKPHFSLRTLTRTLVYVTDVTATYGLRRALFEGFSMSFLTILNKESEGLLLPLIEKHILGSQKNSRALLRQTPRAPQDSRRYVQFQHYWIAQGDVSIGIQPRYILTKFIERNLHNLVRATSTRRFPVLLQGPTSSGKTSMIEYLAIISGNKFVRINNHEHTDLQEYLGSYVSTPDGRLRYQEGILVDALRNGYWIVLDELNLAPIDVLEALNRLLDDNKELLIPETQQTIRPHENFMLFATQNPPGMYGGRKVLSRAFRNRFLELHFDDIPEDELETILRERSQIAPSYCSRIVAVYKKLSILRQRDRLFEQKNSFATLRDLFRWALREAGDSERLAINGFLLLAERVRNTDERLAVKRTIEDIMKVKIDEAAIYNTRSPLVASASTLASTQDIVWTRSMRRLYVLVTEALKRNEPVLLVGDTGSGKTTICQVVAKIMGTKLHIVNAHQNLETGDLIGSQRPVRNRTLIENELAQEMTMLLKDLGVPENEFENDLSKLLEKYDAFLQEDPDLFSAETRDSVEQKRARSKALFEWSDGSLVRAMRNGQPFLLDEISLADDSVLERLNSILELDRTLLLAEKGATDTLVIASQGFQFLATMNPGGDYGKRELSPALRNRFTEIWVPHASDHDEIFEIVQAKLLTPWMPHTSAMVFFAAWYGATYNPGAPAISIRDLLAWIQFVNKYQGPDPFLALLHGAAMVYVDGLGANPAAKVSIPEAEILTQRRACLLKLEDMFGPGIMSLYDAKMNFSLDTKALKLGPFSLDVNGKTNESSTYSMQAPTAKANALKIVRALQLPKPILIEGSPGVGKTTLVVVLAQLIGMPLTRINLSEQTDLMDLFGSDVPVDGAAAGQFAWRDAPFLRAMQKGEWVLLDEMNLASQAVLEGLNACLDHRGQVYISELDQTFTRHPKFAVFAAQNPHHQGCGRKGLPASFVNRFTVVYADPFTPRDLLMICTQNHPGYPSELVKPLTKCVTDIGRLFQMDRRLGIHGAPWEVNLRDLLRWLHLVTSSESLMTAGGPVDYQSLLFLQRFRTSEDVAAVCKVLEYHLPRTERTHTSFYNTSPSHIQVGLGLLARDALLQSGSARRAHISNLDPPLVESVMLCVQNNWPCLLVGPSGSGKTTIMFQLASLTGAEIVNLPLNADMDNTDLVGGYEQVDTKRETVSLVQRLTQKTRRRIVERLVSAPDSDIELIELISLEEKLQAKGPDLAVILDLIRKLDKNHSVPGFSDICDECESVLERSTEDNRARFEWVDGILVKALRQGQWLVLDNANLCSPSVLDRLNSLLEPNGSLSINEHRSLDGCPHDVKPHPNFRLFLAMDPRHGELSRAMRNRCIELYLPAGPMSAQKMALNPASDSSISRFESLRTIDWNSSDHAHSVELSSICLDHFSATDHQLVRQWQREVDKGLVAISPPQAASLSSRISILQRILESNGTIVASVQRTYELLSQRLGLSPEFNAMQTIHPLNNPALVSLTSNHKFSSNLRLLGTFFDLIVETYSFQEKFDSVRRSIQSKPWSQMSRLERSMSSSWKNSAHDSTQGLAKFLGDMGLFMRDFVDGKVSEYQEEGQNIASDILTYLRDILNLGILPGFDEGVFQVHLAIGRLIVAQGVNLLTKKLGSMLDLFNASWQLSTGLSMEILWQVFRPATAKTISHIDTLVQVEELAERFDTLKWRAGASFRDLDLLRRSIVRIYDTIGPTEVDPQMKDIREAIENLESQSSASRRADLPHFHAGFEGLCQYEAVIDSSTKSTSLSLVAGRATKSMIASDPDSRSWHLLSRIEDCTGIQNKDTALIVLRNTLPCSLIAAMENMSEVPLRCLASLRSEMDLMIEILVHKTGAITKNHLHALNCMLASLHKKVYEVHEEKLDPSSFAKCCEYIDQYSQVPLEESLSTDVPVLSMSAGSSTSNLLSRILEDFLNPSLQNLHTTLKQGPESLRGAASAWILFFTGLLYLYVPDRPFDPALKPMVERARHNKRKIELQAKLRALQDFSMMFSGQKTTIRSQIVEKQLHALGNEPLIPSIARPRASELGQVQGEFNNILKSVVEKSPNTPFLQTVFLGQDQAKGKEVELLRSNIAQSISRLSTGYRAYDDITKPLVAMLQGLDTGLVLASLVATPANQINDAITYMCESTPFLGMRPGYFSRTSFDVFGDHRSSNFDPRLSILTAMALSRSTDGNTAHSISHLMHEAFLSLYKEWKEKLGHDQQQEGAKSSMYRYRGGEEEGVELDNNDFLNLFPDYNEEEPTTKRSEASKSPYDPRMLAQTIATCHREIFGTTKTPVEQILIMLSNASKEIGRLWATQTSNSTAICSMPAEQLLCSVILGLDSHHGDLNHFSKPEKTYNFYTDRNLAEAQLLISLIQGIQSQFLTLEEAWPEHATIKDVLQSTSELMALRHGEPIAKLLTKAEQVYGYMHEWEVVASKEYSAVTLYDRLTALLISWRRLELSTWARLLDMEDRKCDEDAEAWWFLAYEIIIAAPLSIIQSSSNAIDGASLKTHAEQLVATLEDFLATTSIGQYAHRLRLIKCFERYLALLAKEEPRMLIVQNALLNFLAYYARFERPIQDSLHKGRVKFERDMKEILLLASWKDTNINALRDSAKRSHHKLFKVIGKYRAHLAQSADKIISLGIPDRMEVPERLQETDTTPQQDFEPSALNARVIPNWHSRPSRFTNPVSTVKNMQRMTQLPPNTIDTATYLSVFADELRENIKLLRKETPSKTTKENVEQIRHLKSRKKKLFADSLKDVRRMGFRSNLSADALTQQFSMAVILAKIPASCTTAASSTPAEETDILTAAEFQFHKLLQVMPRVREQSRNHSDDLSHGEISRCGGYLESMLSIVLKQRVLLVETHKDLDTFDKTMELMRNLCASQAITVHQEQEGFLDGFEKIKGIVRWLPSIIETGRVIVQKHAKLGLKDSTTVVDVLTARKNEMKDLVERYKRLPNLPVLISSSLHEELHGQAEALVVRFKSDLQRLSDENPNLSYILKQISLWTESETKPSNTQANSLSIGFEEFDSSISNFLDIILVSIQRVQEILPSLATSDEESGWLLQSEMAFSSCLRALHPREISKLLEDALSKVCDLQLPVGGNLEVVRTLCAMAIPIVQQYCDSWRKLLGHYANFHRSLCKLAIILAQSFCQIASQGFCSPLEDAATEAGHSEKIEEGTGLGEGEGLEDISKDIKDDEDLTEIAQEGQKEQDKGEIEDQEDAVNMDQDELEGEIGDAPGKDEEGESGSDGGELDMDDEVGDVDDLDPTAVDEKLWDGNDEDAEKEKEGSQAAGKKKKNEQVAAVSAHKTQSENGEVEEEDEQSIDGAEEGEQVAGEENEKLDPHLQEGQNLELPDDMDLDNGDQSSVLSGSDENDAMDSSENEQEDVGDQSADQGDDNLEGDESSNTAQKDEELQLPPEETDDTRDDLEQTDRAGSPVDTEPDADEMETDSNLLCDHTGKGNFDTNDSKPSFAQGIGEDDHQQNDVQEKSENHAQGKEGTQGRSADFDDPHAANEKGQLGPAAQKSEYTKSEDMQPGETSGSQAFKKLGDALEKWHRQHQQIQEACESRDEGKMHVEDIETADQEFEHLANDEARADTQALGAATKDQANTINDNAFDSEMQGQLRENFPIEGPEGNAEDEDIVMEDFEKQAVKHEDQEEQSRPGVMMIENTARAQALQDQNTGSAADEEEEITRLENDLSATELQSSMTSARSRAEALRLWIHYSGLTHSLSLTLTEQLRLVLAPTLANKMRGDFRTGKRLNIKRIIPYIASSFKRDKIWMRRSIPQKRAYQILLAVDDSKSMGESAAGHLAFETLALVAKSLSMLEVGEICVVGFGAEVHVAHEFDKPFSVDAGVEIFRQFTFRQERTDVRKLMDHSITLLRDARNKTNSPGSGDLWQLELIISDGVCEDHERIRRLVRRAQEDHIVVVFVIVDAAKRESILTMSQAIFEPALGGDENGGSGAKLKIKRYLDGFPFPYYLVVGDVRELPGVLATALRQWFAEVVDAG